MARLPSGFRVRLRPCRSCRNSIRSEQGCELFQSRELLLGLLSAWLRPLAWGVSGGTVASEA
jgi:hypothetical protein